MLNDIFNDNRYKIICKQLAGRSNLQDDLYQEFALQIIEKKDWSDVESIPHYCIGLINNIWLNRNRVKCYANGKTSPLYMFTNYLSEGELVDQVDTTYNINVDYTYIAAKNIIEKDMDHSNETEMYRSRVFNYSVNVYKNPRQASKAIGIPYVTFIKAFNIKKEELKERLKKLYYD